MTETKRGNLLLLFLTPVLLQQRLRQVLRKPKTHISVATNSDARLQIALSPRHNTSVTHQFYKKVQITQWYVMNAVVRRLSYARLISRYYPKRRYSIGWHRHTSFDRKCLQNYIHSLNVRQICLSVHYPYKRESRSSSDNRDTQAY
jgi:hypothetical protein